MALFELADLLVLPNLLLLDDFPPVLTFISFEPLVFTDLFLLPLFPLLKAPFELFCAASFNLTLFLLFSVKFFKQFNH